MIEAIPTPPHWISRQTKCDECVYNNTRTCGVTPCFALEHKHGEKIDVYYVEIDGER